MNGCSNKEWLKKGEMPVTGDPAHRKRVLREMSTQQMKVLNLLGLPCKKVSKSKNGFLQNGYLSKINQGSGPTRVSTGFAL
jgi:hypothetical protein